MGSRSVGDDRVSLAILRHQRRIVSDIQTGITGLLDSRNLNSVLAARTNSVTGRVINKTMVTISKTVLCTVRFTITRTVLDTVNVTFTKIKILILTINVL